MAEDKEPFSAVRAAADLQRRQNVVKQAVKDAEGSPPKPKKVSKPRKKEAPSVAEIKKSEHEGSEGETSYGQRMKEPAIEGAKTRFNQTGDDAGDWDD
jgi:hypothetical protein